MYAEAHSLIVISRLLESVCLYTKVIPLSGFHSYDEQIIFNLFCPKSLFTVLSKFYECLTIMDIYFGKINLT